MRLCKCCNEEKEVIDMFSVVIGFIGSYLNVFDFCSEKCFKRYDIVRSKCHS